jgi:hypothetical protein
MLKTRKISPAHKGYLKRLFILMSLYIFFLYIAVVMLGRDNPITGVAAYALGLLPALPVIGIFWAVGRLLIELDDEYQQMLMVRQILVATGCSMAAATGWGFLEQFNLVAHIPAYYWTVLWFAGLGVGSLFNRITLGDAGCA